MSLDHIVQLFTCTMNDPCKFDHVEEVGLDKSVWSRV